MRLYKSVKLLSKLKHPKENDILWFSIDEKNFCQDQKINKQNQRRVTNCPADEPKVMKTKFRDT
ncbi:Uncharacterized protein FKW44_006210, partial [Caligus rogercresseyi]